MKLRRTLVLLPLLLILFTQTVLAGVITLPKGLKEIESYAFYKSASVDTVIAPEGLTTIGSYAFANSSLSSITLPSTVTSISSSAFANCSDLTIIAPDNSYAFNWAVSKGISVSTGSVTYRALLIGNTYPGTFSELPGPDNDVLGMAKMLEKQTQTPYAITSKININATQIRQSISSAFSGADDDDVSLFFYSGHGTTSGELCGIGNTYVTISELRSWLDTVPGKKIVLLDCCYSGMCIDKVETPVDFDQLVIDVFSAKSRANLATEDYIVMTACNKKQTSSSLGYGTSDGNVFWFGAFTYSLAYGSGYNMYRASSCTPWADVSGNNDGSTTLIEAYTVAVDTVNNVLLCRHTPQYYGDTSFVLWSR